MTAVQLLVRSFDMITMVVIARLLTPADFGLVALATSVLLIVNSFTDLPLADVLVQRTELKQSDIDSTFTLGVLRGLLVSVILFALSWPLAALYSDPHLAAVIQVLAITPLIGGASSPLMVHYIRAVDYKPQALLTIVGKIVSFTTVLALAFYTRSYWALIGGLIATPVIGTILTYVQAPYRPRFDTSGIRDILSFASWVTLSKIIFTLNQQADRFCIGWLLGRGPLGQYAMGSDIASMATYSIAGPVMQPLFAGFARMQDDRARLSAAYLKGQQIMVMMIAPLGFGLAVVAERLVTLVLGSAWLPTVPIIWWLAPVVALQMLTVPVQALSMAMRQPKILVVREAISFVLRLPLTLLAAWMGGATAAAATRALTGLLIIGINLRFADQLLGLTLKTQLSNCRRSLLAVLVMTAAVWAADRAMPMTGNVPMEVAQLAGLLLLGAAVYAATLMLLWVRDGKPEGSESWLIGQLIRRQMRVAPG